jgi:hypothetical protein
LLDRQTLTLSGALAGVTLACLMGLVFGPPGSALGALDRLQTRLVSVKLGGSATPRSIPDASRELLKTPLFNAGAGAAPTLRVDGISILPSRHAALISIDGKPSDWIALGDTRGDVTLVDVQANKITVDTDAGFKELALGSGPPAPASALPARPMPPQIAPDLGLFPPPPARAPMPFIPNGPSPSFAPNRLPGAPAGR